MWKRATVNLAIFLARSIRLAVKRKTQILLRAVVWTGTCAFLQIWTIMPKSSLVSPSTGGVVDTFIEEQVDDVNKIVHQ